jgi:hypothetical protein
MQSSLVTFWGKMMQIFGCIFDQRPVVISLIQSHETIMLDGLVRV